MVRSSRVSGIFTAPAKTVWKQALTGHESGCFVGLHVFALENGVPLEALVAAVNKGTLTDKEGLVIGAGVLGIHRC
jgi:hypothetical protein